MCSHVIERRQPEFADGLDDLALADAVAAADLRIIGQGCNGRRRVQGNTSRIGRTEDQGIPLVRDNGPSLQEIEEPGPIGGVAVEHGTDKTVLLEDEALVYAARGIAQNDLLAIFPIREITG